MCEESGEWGHLKTAPQETPERLACAQRLFDQDPYHHHIVIHNGKWFDDLYGPESKYTGASLQTSKTDFSQVHDGVIKVRKHSAEKGKKWAVACDEPGDASMSLAPDESDPDGVNHFNARGNALWGTFLGGGWGDEWYFGYKLPHSDLSCQDYRSRDRFWDYCRYALEFFRNNDVPYWEMEPSDKLTSTGFCFAKAGEVYVVYIPAGGTADVELAKGSYEVMWYNPRKGGALKAGTKVSGGKSVNIGNAPSGADLDWVALIVKK